MNVSPVSFNKMDLKADFKHKMNVTAPEKEIDLPSQADAKSYVNINFRANTQIFDTFILRVTSDKLIAKSFAEIPSAEISGVADKLKKFVIEPLNLFRQQKTNALETGGLIFDGKSGTDRTNVAEALAGETRLPLYKLYIDKVAQYNPKTEKYDSKGNIEKIFEQLNQKFKKTGEPSILHVEDADAFFSELEKENNVLDVILLLRDSEKMGIIPILEPAVKLPIYVSKLLPKFNTVKFSYPNVNGRKVIIKDLLTSCNQAESLLKNEQDINEIAEKTIDISPRELRVLIDRASVRALSDGRRDITKNDILEFISPIHF